MTNQNSKTNFVKSGLVRVQKKVPPWGMFWGVLTAVVFGLPTYLYGELAGNVHLKVAANIGIVLISFLLPVFAGYVQKAGTGPSEDEKP